MSMCAPCLGGLFSKTEMSEVLTEILKVDPSFDKDSFLKQCERDIIPNILEVCLTANNVDTSFNLDMPESVKYFLSICSVILQAMIRGELDVLKDWCYEAV